MDGRHHAEPPLASSVVFLSSPALWTVVVGLVYDNYGHVCTIGCRRRRTGTRAGAADLPDGIAGAGRFDECVGLSPSSRADTRLTEGDLPALRAALSSAGIALTLGPAEGGELLRINHRYDGYLHAMSAWLMITLPPWIPPAEDDSPPAGLEFTQNLEAITLSTKQSPE